jgi:aspartyl-tRNA(Asn)/glutamyl-tRNA(Gln) amidotransferase subunit A
VSNILDPCQWTLTSLAEAIRKKDVSPVEVCRGCLARIDSENGVVNAFITVLNRHALSAAKQAETEIQNGEYRGPLHGIPFGAKDLFLTRGTRTTCGSRILSGFVPKWDAELIERLKGAGAILMGKLNMHEFAFGTTSVNPHYGPVRNPHDPERVSGGSSGGSAAAVAASLVMLSLGTDTGGSIRIPAALCGVSGLKPTYGRLSRHGVYPLAWSMDQPGPIAKTVSDLALAMNVLAGPSPANRSSSQPSPDYREELRADLKGVRIGVPSSYYFDNLQECVAARVNEAIESLTRLGARVRSLQLPFQPEAATAASIVLFAESAASLEKWHRTRAADLGADVRVRLDVGAAVTAAQYLKALRVRAKVRAAFDRVFEEVDALVTPQLPITAPRIGQSEVSFGSKKETVPDALTRFTRIFNFAGIPALSVYCGSDRAGLPVGLQIVAKPFGESMVLRIGHAYQLQGAPPDAAGHAELGRRNQPRPRSAEV